MKIVNLALGLMGMLVFGGCVSTLLQYEHKDSLSKAEASKIIEQVLMEQPIKLRPEFVEIEDDFINYGMGSTSSGNGSAVGLGGSHLAVGVGSSRSHTKQLNNRIYYSAIKDVNVFEKGQKYRVEIKYIDSRPRTFFLVYSKEMAEQLVDALYSLKKNWIMAKGSKH